MSQTPLPLCLMFLFKRLFSTTTKYSPIEQLESIHKLSLAVNGTSSTIEKQALLKQFPASHSTLKRIYDPHLRHFVSSKSITTYLQKHPEIDQRLLFNNLDELLDALSSRTVTGHAACDAVASFYAAYCKTEAHKNIFWRIIDRNLKMGVSVRTIRHLTSENSPSAASKQYNHNKSSNISVALASPYSSTVKNPFNISDGWYASQKLDGIRCITMIQASTNNNYDIQFYSRTGRPFTSLQKVKLEIEKRLQNQAAVLGEFVLDGEICAYNDDTKNEDFFKALSQVRRINEEMENPIYQVFDFITLQSFLEAKGDEKFVIRQKQLKKFIGKDPLPHIKLIEQKELTSMDQLDLMKEQAIVKGWEGLILRKNVAYEGKRT
jgi:DNA ligase-1